MNTNDISINNIWSAIDDMYSPLRKYIENQIDILNLAQYGYHNRIINRGLSKQIDGIGQHTLPYEVSKEMINLLDSNRPCVKQLLEYMSMTKFILYKTEFYQLTLFGSKPNKINEKIFDFKFILYPEYFILSCDTEKYKYQYGDKCNDSIGENIWNIIKNKNSL